MYRRYFFVLLLILMLMPVVAHCRNNEGKSSQSAADKAKVIYQNATETAADYNREIQNKLSDYERKIKRLQEKIASQTAKWSREQQDNANQIIKNLKKKKDDDADEDEDPGASFYL